MKLRSTQEFARRAALATAALAVAVSIAPASLKAQDAPPQRIHELVNLEFASEYVTPRGMLVHDQGLTFQPLFLTLVNLYHVDSFLNDVSFAGGCWNDFSSAGVSVNGPYGSKPKTDWTEVDPIADLTLGFAKNFKLDVTYTAFAEQILNIGISQHLETKLSFDDSAYLGAWALHPYFSYWQELQGKATDADLPYTLNRAGARAGASHPDPNSSYYFDVGVDPSYTFKNTLGGLKLEAPCRVMLPDDRFYGDYYASSSTVGIWEVGLKGTVPMNFMPAGYGHWSFHAGVNFLYFEDDNLVNLNIFNAPGKPTRDTLQGFSGISVFF
jgi:hypothetical protein